ncbi:hypothetical protein ANN_27796 [Periplaneta americana]|uniref:Uncharacterized protein n=1 Tax=Periplaneta americana TaxID=6978 RepID=A0ABQ8RVC7_PERAM|nr:hypothetical protein ANN_27796 [Periplaneta americana]
MIEYQRILEYRKTLWLSLMPAVERILKPFPALEFYFLSQQKCSTVMQMIFTNPCTELWLFFVHNISAIFDATVLKIEKQSISVLEVSSAIDERLQKQKHFCSKRSEDPGSPSTT